MEQIYIIIPFFDGWLQLKTCLDALRASRYDNREVIVVNHGTEDEARGLLRDQYPEVLQIFGSPALWWAGATNLGIRTAMSRGAKKIMLLNHDCYVEPDMIQRIAAHAERTSDALIAPVQRDFFSKRVLCITASTCYLLGFPTSLRLGKNVSVLGEPRLLPTKLIIGGRGVLIPRSVFERMGMFDEVNLPHAGSDNDFYLRCRRQQVPLLIATDATVYVDNTRTTLAANLEQMNLKQFLQTLTDRRSHRNVRDLNALFKLHYPIKGLHPVGVALNLLRYCTLYGWKRLKYVLATR